MALRRCSYTHCPQLIPAGKRYCAEHGRAHERERGTTTQRGYGATHRRLRARWQAAIDNGAAPLCPAAACPSPAAKHGTSDITTGATDTTDPNTRAATAKRERPTATACANTGTGKQETTWRLQAGWAYFFFGT